jgi:hypothetical protein
MQIEFPPERVAGGARNFSIIDAMIIDFPQRAAFFRPFREGFPASHMANMRSKARF